MRLAGVSGLLGLFLAYWSLRSVLLTVIVFAAGVVSAAFSLGTVWITGQTIDAITMSMPSLVYVLSISGAVHLINYYGMPFAKAVCMARWSEPSNMLGNRRLSRRSRLLWA